MLDWLMKNKEWVFSGIGVAVLTAIVGWIWSKKGKDEAGTHITQQSNVNGDNVGRDKIIKG